MEKLHQEYQDFLSEPLSSRHAINCAMTAWHLKDWVWAGHLKKTKPPNLDTQPKLDDFIIKSCPELRIMFSIATGSKYCIRTDLRHPKDAPPIVESTNLRKGGFDRGFNLGFDTSRLEVQLDDNSFVVFDNKIAAVVQFWDKFFSEHVKP